MAGALFSHYDDNMLPPDNTFLEEVSKNLISSGVQLSPDLVVRVANISLDLDLFDLDPSEQFDWTIFCDWLVTSRRRNYRSSEATHQSELTYRKDEWTKSFKQAGLKGFTIVGRDHGFDVLKSLALENNKGISMSGDEYSFSGPIASYRAQNYIFARNSP